MNIYLFALLKQFLSKSKWRDGDAVFLFFSLIAMWGHKKAAGFFSTPGAETIRATKQPYAMTTNKTKHETTIQNYN